jgi:signal transduction histidine kinase
MQEQMRRLLDCFQKGLGHELSNQLVAIQGLLQVLRLEEGDRLDEAGRDYLQRLTAAARRAHGLVADLAAVARVCRDDLPVEPVGLADAAREAAAEVNQLFPGHSIEYHFGELAPVLTVSRLALRQVFVQLLRNAVQAAVPGRPLRIDIGSRTGPAGLEFWVADNGRGVPAEQLPNLFLPFPPGGGTGLGLFVVRQIITNWGGTVRVESEPGEGSIATITVGRS